jgi:hypothetical protein
VIERVSEAARCTVALRSNRQFRHDDVDRTPAARVTMGASMKGTLSAAIAVSLLVVSGCSTSTSSDDFTLEDAVDCRELGGGWVFIRYERENSFLQGDRLGLPTTDEGLLAEPDVTDEQFEEATRLRVAEGWDDATVSQLSGPDVSPELTARLADSPSCLVQLTSARS